MKMSVGLRGGIRSLEKMERSDKTLESLPRDKERCREQGKASTGERRLQPLARILSLMLHTVLRSVQRKSQGFLMELKRLSQVRNLLA